MVDAKVNFGASKLTVYGEAAIEELEKAGAFEKLVIFPEKEKLPPKPRVPFWKKHLLVEIALLLTIAGYFLDEAKLLFALAILIGGYRLFKTGLQNLIRFDFDMKALMTIAILGAAIIGQWSEGAVVVILFAISEILESYSMDKARESIRSLMEMSPKEATVIRNGQELTLEVEDIEIGDTMLVKPGQLIAMDGLVTEGSSTVNQAAITGESAPVKKSCNDEVFAGTLNEEGFLKIKVTKHSDDTTFAKIIHLVEEAQSEKAPSQQFVDRFAKYYTPAIMLIAAITAIVPPVLFDASWQKWIYQGLAILVVGCPCALVVSTPVSIVTAIGNAARHGVLIKGGNYLEETGALTAIAFDKTGTLTKGLPSVTDIVPYSKSLDKKQILTLISALESRSQHPLAAAIIRKAEQEGLPFRSLEIEGFTSITGKGITGLVDQQLLIAGSERLFEHGQLTTEIRKKAAEFQNQGKTVILAGNEQEIFALLAVADEAREESSAVIQQLHQLGIEKTIMLTGDHQATAIGIGRQVMVSDTQAELLPEDKLTFIKKMKAQYGRVAMVGDGVNDAPALAAATVGFAMGGAGTDAALETADIVFMKDDLKKLPFTIKLGRETLRIIKQNIGFSLLVKLVALLLVVPGWLTLWIAIFADMGTTLLVTLNGLRLLRVKE